MDLACVMYPLMNSCPISHSLATSLLKTLLCLTGVWTRSILFKIELLNLPHAALFHATAFLHAQVPDVDHPHDFQVILPSTLIGGHPRVLYDRLQWTASPSRSLHLQPQRLRSSMLWIRSTGITPVCPDLFWPFTFIYYQIIARWCPVSGDHTLWDDEHKSIAPAYLQLMLEAHDATVIPD